MKSPFKICTYSVLLVLITFSFCCKGRKFYDDLTDFKLKGRVKSWTAFEYDGNKTDNIIDSNYKFKTASCYNIAEKTTSFFLVGNPKEKRIYIGEFVFYDSKGRQVLTKDKSGNLVDSSVYSINKKNCLMETTSLGTKMVYSRKGLKDTLYREMDSGNFKKDIIYIYNKSSDLIKEINYQTNGTIVYTTTFSYDGSHHKIGEASYDSVGKKYEKMTYSYDDKGNIVTEIDSNVIRSGGSRVQGTSHVEGAINVLTFRYSFFDKNNNWLREDDLWNNKYPKSILRKIEYYP